MRRKDRTNAWWVFILLFVAGCGGGPVPVEGTVTLDGKPVEGAIVQLEPETGGQGAVAVTDLNGRFTVDTALGHGALPGDYRVTVAKVVGPPLPGRAPEGATPEQLDRWTATFIAALRAQKSAVPYVYSTLANTPLKCTVPPTGELALELQSSRFGEVPYVHSGLSMYLRK